MSPLKITEIFAALQGEGARAGEASVFVRLAGCDHACGFCDTEFESGVMMQIGEIAERAKAFRIPWLVWTGGEPCLQLRAEHVKEMHRLGLRQAIETNGNHTPPAGIDWVACSPKVAEHVLQKSFPMGVDELRYVRHAGQPGIPAPKIVAKHKFLSPLCNGGLVVRENLEHCIKLCLENPEWKLSIQMHKLWRSL